MQGAKSDNSFAVMLLALLVFGLLANGYCNRMSSGSTKSRVHNVDSRSR